MTSADEILTTHEVATILRANVATIRYWRRRGVGPRSFKIGGRDMYRRDDLDAWLADQYDADTRAS